MARPESITFVTGNPGKVEEMRAVLDPLGIAVIQDSRGYPEIQHEELQGVAEAGAGYLLATGLEAPFILEDAGLFVAALQGFPGVYSSYVFKTLGNAGILRLLEGMEKEMRTATFRANLLYVDEDGRPHHFEGSVKGHIAERAEGDAGFGYDPIFVPEGESRTFAQFSTDEKTQISHRGRAARAFAEWVANQ